MARTMQPRARSSVPAMSPGEFLKENSRIISAVVGLVVVVLVFRMLNIEQALVIGVINGAMYGLIALGLVLVYKGSGIFNFAQGEFGTVAIYVLWLLLERNIPYGFAVIVALVIAIGLGLATERVVVRRLYSSPRVILLVATAGVGLLCLGFEFWIGQPIPRTVAPALSTTDRVSIFGVLVSDQRLLLLFVLILFGAGLAYFFNKTPLGLALLGYAQEPTATELVGINTKWLAAFTWGLAALLGGLAGILNAPIAGQFTPGFMTLHGLIPAFTAAVLGGMTSLPGAFAGGVIVGIAESLALTAPVFAAIPSPDTAIVFVLLLLVLVIRPQGLFGRST